MSKEEKIATAVIDRINKNIDKFGLRLTFTYHCNRCDYQWLPKDFDVIGEERTFRDLFELMPPNSCARCKSKLWRTPRQRNRKLPGNVPDRLNDGMLTVPRIKAAMRNQKRLMAQVEKIRKEFPITKDIRKQTPIPIRLPHRKKKKKV